MDLVVKREDLNDDRTIGRLFVDAVFECWTLEDTVRPPGIKVWGATAIPAGRYRVIITHSKRFNRDLPLLLGVPNFDGIRIHPGNTSADTEGCILVGQDRTTDSVTSSRAAMALLLPKIEQGEKDGGVWITVSDPDETPADPTETLA